VADERAKAAAKVASAMLGRPELGVTRISYVGLTDREAAHLAATTKAYGLDTRLERGANGHVHVTVAPPAPPQVASLLPGPPAPSLRERVHWWLRNRGEQLHALLNGRTV
jgi:hypothetical protein